MTRRKLGNDELQDALKELPGWTVADGPKLAKSYKFDSFAQAMGWMVSVAIHADKMNHHPNWTNVYNRVMVELWTHDLGGISTWDLELAAKMDSLAG
jgi:4a-hydroxytetrahydrobiopterin dehydratase